MAANGNSGAGKRDKLDLSQLSASYDAPLRRYFLRRGAYPDQAEDLVQEVYTRLVAMRSTQKIDNAQAYIFRIAANLMTDTYRKNARQPAWANEVFDEETHYSPSNDFSPERILLGREQLNLLKQAILKLPEKPRDVFILHRFEGFKYYEIADALHMSVSAVEKHMMAALAGIAERFER